MAQQRRRQKALTLARYIWDRAITSAELLAMSDEERRKLARAAGVRPTWQYQHMGRDRPPAGYQTILGATASIPSGRGASARRRQDHLGEAADPAVHLDRARHRHTVTGDRTTA